MCKAQALSTQQVSERQALICPKRGEQGTSWQAWGQLRYRCGMVAGHLGSVYQGRIWGPRGRLREGWQATGGLSTKVGLDTGGSKRPYSSAAGCSSAQPPGTCLT